VFKGGEERKFGQIVGDLIEIWSPKLGYSYLAFSFLLPGGLACFSQYGKVPEEHGKMKKQERKERARMSLQQWVLWIGVTVACGRT